MEGSERVGEIGAATRRHEMDMVVNAKGEKDKSSSNTHTHSRKCMKDEIFAVTHTPNTHSHSQKHAHQCQRETRIGNGSWGCQDWVVDASRAACQMLAPV